MLIQKIKKETLENEDEEQFLERSQCGKKDQLRGILTSNSFLFDPAICSTTIK